jgi:glycosyltransferase involved in cell wall biosynthesis
MNHKVLYHQMLASPHLGGGEKVAIEIHEHVVANRGPISQLILPGGGEVEQNAKQAGLPFVDYRIDRLTSPGRVTTIFENIILWAKIARKGPSIVHVHAPFVYGAARLFFSGSRLKTVLHIHLDYSVEQLRWALRRPPDLILSCAGFMKGFVEQAISEEKFSPNRIKVIQNAINLRRFLPTDPSMAKTRLGIRDDIPLLMMVANLAPHKGQETAVRAVAALKNRGHETNLWLVGTEREVGQAYINYLRELSKQLGINDQVDFVGFRNDVPELLAAADFLLLPSTSEGLPLVILEAQASKAVTLAAPTAGIPEVIDNGRTGFLIDAKDHEAYADCIARLLVRPDDAKAIKDDAYRQVCNQHNIDTYCGRVLQEYDRLLSVL